MSRIDDITQRLEEDKLATVDFFVSLTPQQLVVELYTEGVTWRVRDLLAHLTTIERSMQWQFKNILEGGPGSTPEFDIERYNRSQVGKLVDAPFNELIDNYEAVRDETISIVGSMQDSDLDREGEHPALGHDRLETFVRWAYKHAVMHMDDARRALMASAPDERSPGLDDA